MPQAASFSIIMEAAVTNASPVLQLNQYLLQQLQVQQPFLPIQPTMTPAGMPLSPWRLVRRCQITIPRPLLATTPMAMVISTPSSMATAMQAINSSTSMTAMLAFRCSVVELDSACWGHLTHKSSHTLQQMPENRLCKYMLVCLSV